MVVCVLAERGERREEREMVGKRQTDGEKGIYHIRSQGRDREEIPWLLPIL
jgi:hypothetical protein